jgi:hypothetical protein
MAQERNDGTAYLQALKQADTVSSGAPAAAAGTRPSSDPAPATADADRHDGVEKRRSPRYKCEGSAEMTEEGCETRAWASFKDISMHGCYVEATSTYAVGTNLVLKLAANGFQVSGKGAVRVNYPYLGMGIAFTEMSQDDRTRLRSLLQAITRPSVILGPGAAAVASPASLREPVPVISNPAAAVQALIQVFEKRQMLLRDEFVRILRNSEATAKAPDV